MNPFALIKTFDPFFLPFGRSLNVRRHPEPVLFYSKHPNTEDIVWQEAELLDPYYPFGGWKLPDSMFATVGNDGFWFIGGVAQARTMTAILALPTTNTYNGMVFASPGNGVGLWAIPHSAEMLANLELYFGIEIPEAPTGWIETFDGAGYTQTWNETGGTPDEDYATAPCPLSGTHSLALPYNSHTEHTHDVPITSVDFLIHFTAVSQAADAYLMELRAADGLTVVLRLVIRSTDLLRIIHGTFALSSAFTAVAGTTYHLWITYTKGTGANGQAELFVTPYTGTELKPGTPSAVISTGTATADAMRLRLTHSNSNTGGTVFYDNVKINQ